MPTTKKMPSPASSKKKSSAIGSLKTSKRTKQIPVEDFNADEFIEGAGKPAGALPWEDERLQKQTKIVEVAAPKKVASFRLEEALLLKLEYVAKKLRYSKTELVEEALSNHLEGYLKSIEK